MTGHRPTVLVADDEKHVRQFMKAMLAKFDCEVVGEACSGEETIHLCSKHKPDLLLLDHNMPYKSGDEVIEELAGKETVPRIILLSSVTDADSVTLAVEHGVALYLRKDLPIDEIMQRIEECLQQLRGGAGPQCAGVEDGEI